MKRVSLISILILVSSLVDAQTYSRQDSLRGSVTLERAWWDLIYYHLDIEVNPKKKSLEGSVLISYEVLEPNQTLQVDLQSPLKISKIIQEDRELDFQSEGNAHFVKLKKAQKIGAMESIKVFYGGQPREAVKAPWDGGISWKEDENGNPFVASSCQGLGASVWWPCKDHMYDEVDSMLISVEVPKDLVNVSNGRLRKVQNNRKKKTKTYHWFVNNPINNYGVNINVGDYVNWKEVYNGEKGELDITYWALTSDQKQAKEQFKQVPTMLEALEHWLGPYPFYEDGYQLVQAPYLGMEHQSSITYGNNFQNGYRGIDLSGTGWGLKFDFIIVHESGHEWFANNITAKDLADMWIHEGFTNYSESLFLEYHYGKEAGQEYVRGTRKNIQNQFPMIGPYDVNHDISDTDVYYMGANLLNMVRTQLNDDEKWLSVIRGLGQKFYHQTVTSEQIENFMTEKTGLDLGPIFDQYLRTKDVPIFEYYFQDGKLKYRFTNCQKQFTMPLDLTMGGEKLQLKPTSAWQETESSFEGDLSINPNYYLGILKSR